MDIAMLGPSDMLHLRRLVPAIAQRGHRVHVVSMKPDPIPGATFERFAVPSLSLRYPYRWRHRWEAYLRDLFKRFDVVDMHFLWDWGITRSATRYGHLVVTTYGSDVDPPPDCPYPDPESVQSRQELLRCADKVIAPSRWLTQKVADFAGLDPSKIETIPVGVDLDLFAPRRPHQNHNPVYNRGGSRKGADTPIVGYFKGFKPVYDPMTMVDAIPHVLTGCPDTRFDLVGSGFLRDACQKRAQALGVHHAIRWIDHQPHQSIPNLLARWDVVPISSIKESLCVAALESAAMEIPVVATRVGGLCEAVKHSQTGLLVEPQNARALADALVTLLKNPSRRRAMGIAGRRHVAQHFEWNQYIDRTIDLYRGLVPRDGTHVRLWAPAVWRRQRGNEIVDQRDGGFVVGRRRSREPPSTPI